MATMNSLNSVHSLFFLLLTIILILSDPPTVIADHDTLLHKKTYIVHVEPPSTAAFTSSAHLESWYKSFLPKTNSNASPADSPIVHMYSHVTTGFAARLTESEVHEISKMEGFVRAYPSRRYTRLTTRTPQFLGLSLNTKYGLWNQSGLGKGIVIGVIDGGLYPNHPSFSDVGMPPPPTKWKGWCDYNASLCNNKLIGARSFFAGAAAEVNVTDEVESALIDNDGHGTHVASIAAGAFAPGAQILASGVGVASGMAPLAHIAMYKVCAFGAPEDCVGADILAGIDAAVADGVDVLSLSLGGDPGAPFYEVELTVATFGAIKKGVFPSASAGNGGPSPSSLVNEAPWLLTVAASTFDRRIKATVKLGNGMQFDGQSLFQPAEFKPNLYPLIYAGASRNADAALCGNGSLDGLDVRGKIVLCDQGTISRVAKGEFVKSAGGIGMILASTSYTTFADPHVLPASFISFADGAKLKAYINATTNPTAAIVFKGMVIEKRSRDPAIASFSSRGPSVASPGILKPDITAPGVDVLGAWPPMLNNRGMLYNFLSGTSMSAPHIGGIAALLKCIHPHWSVAMIKSAIMTTAYTSDHSGKPIMDERRLTADLFAIGSGHVNPEKAKDPGLVYDISPRDYIPYLCGLGYNNTQVKVIVGNPVECVSVGSIAESELNYPSVSVLFSSGTSSVTVMRTVKNVGEAKETYWAVVSSPMGFSVTVEPNVLRFEKMNQEMKFKMIFSRNSSKATGSHSQGDLIWVSKNHVVRSPISVTF